MIVLKVKIEVYPIIYNILIDFLLNLLIFTKKQFLIGSKMIEKLNL